MITKTKTSFEEIFSTIKNKIDIHVTLNLTTEDFIYDYVTFKLKIISPDKKHIIILYEKFTREFIIRVDIFIFKQIVEKLKIQIAKKYWRLNNKRIRHNLKSWI